MSSGHKTVRFLLGIWGSDAQALAALAMGSQDLVICSAQFCVRVVLHEPRRKRNASLSLVCLNSKSSVLAYVTCDGWYIRCAASEAAEAMDPCSVLQPL